MKPLFRFKWATFEERMDVYRREAFCRTFGHGTLLRKGLFNPVTICSRCRDGVKP